MILATGYLSGSASSAATAASGDRSAAIRRSSSGPHPSGGALSLG